MKSFKELVEGIKKWSDVRDRKLKKDASDVLKALDKGQVLGYSVEHDEFSIFNNAKDFKKAQKDKRMKWIVVESKKAFSAWLADGKKISFSPHQKLFHMTRTKRNYILVQQAAKGSPPSVKLYGSASIHGLLADHRETPALAVDDWNHIQRIFLGLRAN